jgi:hypothetical protein
MIPIFKCTLEERVHSVKSRRANQQENTMRMVVRVLVLSLLLSSDAFASLGQEQPCNTKGGFYSFNAWKGTPASDRGFLYIGFLNGFVTGARSSAYDNLARCIDKNVTAEQAVAMIDKYSTENPQRWSAPLPMGIVEALTVKDGPCPNMNPFK